MVTTPGMYRIEHAGQRTDGHQKKSGPPDVPSEGLDLGCYSVMRVLVASALPLVDNKVESLADRLLIEAQTHLFGVSELVSWRRGFSYLAVIGIASQL